MKRIPQLDYLKGILILLVISFHLVYFEQLHPDIKQVVYAFHMPGFLLLSGYLMNISKPPLAFLRTLLWLAVPYLVMESGYIVMASLLPINEHIERLTPAVFLDRLLLHPLGPYWYLHTLILCGAIYYIIYRQGARGKEQGARGKEQGARINDNLLPLAPCSLLLLTGIIYYALSRGLGMLTFSSALYFLAGAAIRQSGMDFRSVFWASPFAVLVFFLLAFFSDSPNQANIAGILIAWSAISSLLWTAPSPIPSPEEAEGRRRKGSLPLVEKAWKGVVFLGRNSLVLYVFSPIFTILCKQFVPYLRFDPTGLLFLFVSLAVCVTGCLAIAWAMDFTGISRFFFGRKAIWE